MKLLYVNACVRENSRTNILAEYMIKRFSGKIQEIKLNEENIPSLNSERLSKRDFYIQNNNFADDSFKYAKDFSKADIILVAAPYWDLSFPSLLKTYFENINVCGLTFSYSQEGFPITHCKAKKLIYITTAGGPILSDEFGFGYVKSLAENFYGIKDISYIKAEGLDILGADTEKILETAKNEIIKIII